MEALFCIIFALFICLSNSQIVFPDDNTMNSNQNTDKKQPVYIPGQCPENQWYWPGKQENDWMCDCASRFVYYPKTDKCYELFRQGPCKKNEYLTLSSNKTIAECVRNPCMNDTMVSFDKKCHRLYKTDACVEKGGGILHINHNTLELQCLPASAAELNIIQIRNMPCPPGSKRSASGQCRVVVG